jgi:hypothetical protein
MVTTKQCYAGTPCSTPPSIHAMMAGKRPRAAACGNPRASRVRRKDEDDQEAEHDCPGHVEMFSLLATILLVGELLPRARGQEQFCVRLESSWLHPHRLFRQRVVPARHIHARVGEEVVARMRVCKEFVGKVGREQLQKRVFVRSFTRSRTCCYD